jgi:glycosyltransferase involved in cell wall biosynthesis
VEEKEDTGIARVLFVSDHFGHADGVIHGATRYFLTVLPRLLHRGTDLHVAFLRGEHSASELIKDQGITPTFYGRSKFSPLSILDVLRTVRRKRIQVIHCAGMKGILTARIAGRIAGVPVLSHLHDSEPVSGVMQRLMRLTTKWSARTLAVSHEVAEHAEKTLKIDLKQTEVLHNGLVLDEMRSVSEETGHQFRRSVGLLPDEKVIGIIGRLAPVKGHDTLLRAMPTVLAKEPKAWLLIIGDGPNRESLNLRVHDLGLKGYVTFTGQIDNVYEALRGIDVVAMPSLREGLPYSLLEAMAMGKPVVASAVGGLAGTIRHCENGVLVRPQDAQALAEALISVFTDPLLAETIIHGALDTARSYDIEYHVDRLLALYSAMASGRPTPPPAQRYKSSDPQTAKTQSDGQPAEAPAATKTP